jgi:enoyl-CoA hydratase
VSSSNESSGVRAGAASGRVSLTVTDGVATIALDRPPVNALSSHMYAELAQVATRIAEDDLVRVAILTGTGSCFCGGADVKELRSQTPEQRQAFWAVTADARRRFLGIPVPVIAAIDGAAAGAGVAYATYCDYRIAARTARLSMPEINVGSVAGGGEALLGIGMPRGAIRYLLFSGTAMSAEEALHAHLVDEVSDSALGLARERAAVIAEKPRPALVAMKRAINLASASAAPTEDMVAQTQKITLEMMADRA